MPLMVWGIRYPIIWHLSILSILELKENGRGKIDSLTTSFSPGIGQKTLMCEVSHLNPEERSIFISEAEKNLEEFEKQKPLLSFPQFTTFSLYRLHFPTTFYSSENRLLKTLRFNHFFRSLFPYEDKYMHMLFSC